MSGWARDTLKDATAGLIAAVVLIANIVSFAAMMFQGDLAIGIPTAIWSMLIGSCIGGVWIALFTTLRPLATGIDSPTGTVLVVLSATVGTVVAAAGGSPQAAVQSIMLVFTAATFITGGLLCFFGARRWGGHFRFVPFFVVGGFLASTGYLLIAGGYRMTAGGVLSLGSLASLWGSPELPKLVCAIAVLGVLLALRRWVKSAIAMPVALLAMCFTVGMALKGLGLSGAQGGWYLPSMGNLDPWMPFSAMQSSALTGAMLLKLAPDTLAVTVVALISLITKVSSLEVARQTPADLDNEFRCNGIGSLLAAPFGGLTSSLQVGTSRLLEQAGGVTRVSGVVCSLFLGLVAITNLDLPALIPTPIVAGLVFFLGYTFLQDALWKPYLQRAWRDLILAIAIMVMCVVYGYLVGVLAGLVGACILFAISYSRLSPVRRHATRASFASYVVRSPETSEHLRIIGESIQLYWISGYLFFGSSESLFERIRADIDARPRRSVTHVILDFSAVEGADSSGVGSLTKLRNFCTANGAELLFASLSPTLRASFERRSFFLGKHQQGPFEDINLCLAWCEDQVLMTNNLRSNPDHAEFEPWLQNQLGTAVKASDLIHYLERKDLKDAELLYGEGDPADSVDLVAAGSLSVNVATVDGLRCVRRMASHTIVGEMGFFERSVRSAGVYSNGQSVIFTLSRDSFERMRRDRPDLGSAFYDFIIRVLSDRIRLADPK